MLQKVPALSANTRYGILMLDTGTLVWSQPSIYSEGTGVHHGYSTKKAEPPNPSEITYYTGNAVHGKNAWYAKLDPGGFIVPHVDQGPWMERWHYPISGTGYVWQRWIEDRFIVEDGLTVVALPSKPYRMVHYQPHAVWNPFDEPRVVLIVEYDNPIDQPTTDLIICDMIPEVQTMVDAISADTR